MKNSLVQYWDCKKNFILTNFCIKNNLIVSLEYYPKFPYRGDGIFAYIQKIGTGVYFESTKVDRRELKKTFITPNDNFLSKRIYIMWLNSFNCRYILITMDFLKMHCKCEIHYERAPILVEICKIRLIK